MKVKFFLFTLISIVTVSCQNSEQKSQKSVKKDSVALTGEDLQETYAPNETKFSLALSSNSLKIIDQSSGSTNTISFETPVDKTIETIEKVLKSKPAININSECGAGPLKMATWENGLTLLFKKNKESWLFVGWAANEPKIQQMKLTTMAGIGVGSTKKEMESAYSIKVSKTSLGSEFSTHSDDLFGIFDGPDENAKITNLWSGISCNFR